MRPSGKWSLWRIAVYEAVAVLSNCLLVSNSWLWAAFRLRPTSPIIALWQYFLLNIQRQFPKSIIQKSALSTASETATHSLQPPSTLESSFGVQPGAEHVRWQRPELYNGNAPRSLRNGLRLSEVPSASKLPVPTSKHEVGWNQNTNGIRTANQFNNMKSQKKMSPRPSKNHRKKKKKDPQAPPNHPSSASVGFHQFHHMSLRLPQHRPPAPGRIFRLLQDLTIQ